MSAPTFPHGPNGGNANREQAAIAVLFSIAAEELGLAHILNAEGEKIQAAVGTLHEGDTAIANTITDLVDIDCSVQQTVEAVLLKNIVLELKFTNVLRLLGVVCPVPSSQSGSGSMWGG